MDEEPRVRIVLELKPERAGEPLPIYVVTSQGDFCARCGAEASWDDGGLWCYPCKRYLIERGERCSE